MKENPKFVLPKVYLVGHTVMIEEGMRRYLGYTDQEEFLKEIQEAKLQGLSDGEILCSFYAKACYASLTDKKNKNISKVRSIEQNLLGTIESEHGSVFEHCNLNFMITDCSRVFTHELVRHRVGTAFSQTSGRYVRGNDLKLVIDPILEPVEDEIENLRQVIEHSYRQMEDMMGLNSEGLDFGKKKKITSALRRILPNGIANEIGFSLNLRTLRQTIEARTSRHAEWEIRVIFNKIADCLWVKYPMIFQDAEYKLIEGAFEIKFKNKNI